MAEGISPTVCPEEKMISEENSQGNSSIANKDSDEFVVEFDPRPQRPLKLNRRGFFLLNREEEKQSPTEISPGTVSSCKQNNTKKPENFYDRLKSSPSGKKIIKLTSKSPVSETQNGVKRSSNSTDSNGVDPPLEGTPPKKKHKPITWP